MPLNIGTAEIPHFVRLATVELFEVFGKESPLPIYEEIGAKVLHRIYSWRRGSVACDLLNSISEYLEIP